MNADADAKVHTEPPLNASKALDTLKAFRRLVLPLLLGLGLLAAVVAQARSMRQTAGGVAFPTRTANAAAAAPARADERSPAAGATSATGAAGAGRVAAEGRLVAYPGAQVVVGSDLPGTLVRLTVQEKERVRRGQLLAELRADDLRSQLAEAQAKAAEAAADLRFATQDAERARFLAEQNAGTRREAERTVSGRDGAAARLATVQAELRRLEAVLAKTRITAPIDGTVIERAVQPGEHVEAGAALLTIANLDRTRIEAEVDEFDAGHVALGAPVRVSVEGFEGRTWRAHVEEVPDSVVARKLRPQDPGRPADTRVLLVKIALDEPSPIKLGQRVEVDIAPSPPRRLIG